MIQWEYKTYRVHPIENSNGDGDKIINELGLDGWEAYAISYLGQLIYYLKRKVDIKTQQKEMRKNE